MSGPTDDPLPPGAEIPDDARELDLDVLAWRREERARARRGRWQQVFPRRHERWAIGSVLAIVAMVVTAGLAGLLVALFGPQPRQPHAGVRPLASTDTPIGEVGGLLPNVSVTIDHAAHRLRNVRPAALALVPAGCRCDGLINELSGQTEEFDIRLFLVGSRAGDPQLADLLQSATRGRTAAVDDTGGVLVRTYRPVGVTLVLVRADGVVTRVARHVAITARFEPDLSRLVY